MRTNNNHQLLRKYDACDCKTVTEVYYKYDQSMQKKKVGGGDKEPQITEGRAVNIAWSDCSTVTLRAVKQKDENKFCLCVCTCSPVKP